MIACFIGVSKSYGHGAWAVRDLDLEVKRGEFLTLLGPSGSGKTTTLMMLAGFEEPTAGVVTVEGRPMRNLPPHRRNFGVVFQNYALFPHLTVRQNVAFPLEVRGQRGHEVATKVDRVLDLVHLDGYGERRPAQLSGGQQQRVALARALVFDPELVLMDEPLAALDKQLRQHMQFELKELQRRLGVTVVYVTHDQGEALTMSDRVAVFNHGCLEQIAAPREIYDAPATPFVAQFIGESNRLLARVVATAKLEVSALLEDGSAVTGAAVAACTPGTPVQISIRPERVIVGAATASLPNRMQVTIENTIFVGDHQRVQVITEAGARIIAKLPVTAADIPATPGAKVSIGWLAADCRMFPIAVGEPITGATHEQ